MDFQEKTTTAPEDFESLRKTNVMLLRINKALCIKSNNLTTDKEALQKRMNELTGQDTQESSSVPETPENQDIDPQEQSTSPGDCESLRQANKILLQKNVALRLKNGNKSRDIEALQNKINDLISQRSQVTSSVSEMSMTTESAEAVYCSSDLQEFNAILERLKVIESEHDRLSLRRRFVRLFIPGWKRRYSSRETMEYVESGEQAGETQRRPTLRERFVNFCNQRFRRRRT